MQSAAIMLINAKCRKLHMFINAKIHHVYIIHMTSITDTLYICDEIPSCTSLLDQLRPNPKCFDLKIVNIYRIDITNTGRIDAYDEYNNIIALPPILKGVPSLLVIKNRSPSIISGYAAIVSYYKDTGEAVNEGGAGNITQENGATFPPIVPAPTPFLKPAVTQDSGLNGVALRLNAPPSNTPESAGGGLFGGGDSNAMGGMKQSKKLEECAKREEEYKRKINIPVQYGNL
jgi:hypothetical protein